MTLEKNGSPFKTKKKDTRFILCGDPKLFVENI